ncbi:hypothetical protein F5144DRAFT_604249 [Chaetomium tenue]|uniref:Uncharacterized protein n=1 Tax=Chaetomium tenue TaxID=1854479 RepID=A0ACB7P551_9PEZI|nr:hypothetical protein F5144DRAFT_604249 [Chaetomium globosum]
MSEQTAPQQIPGTETPNSHPETVNGISAPDATDISMTDAPSPAVPQPQHNDTTTSTTAPAPASSTARIPTPVPTPGQPPQQQQQNQNQNQPSSRAASQHPADTTTTTTTTTTATGFAMPTEAAAHGAPVRQYLNSKVTGVLLEGMKIVAREQPKDPLRMLGEFLLQKSKELEGKEGSS